jgi:hypothetical protein
MQNNNHNNYFLEDEIDLKHIFMFLNISKKLIIAITLVITSLGVIYAYQKAPVYKSTALMQIGKHYGIEALQRKGIEPTVDLIEELRIQFIHKKQVSGLTIQALDGAVFELSIKSPSSVENIKLLNEIVTYANNRHSNLLRNNNQRITNQLTYKIENINNQIEYTNSTLLIQKEDKKLRIANQIININNALLNINRKVKALNKVIIEVQGIFELLESHPDLFIQRSVQSATIYQVNFTYKQQLIDLDIEKINLSQEKDNLESQLKFLESNNLESEKVFRLSQEKDNLGVELEFLMQNITKTQLIGEIVTTEDQIKKEKIILLSFIIGLILSIFMVFTNNFLKAFKEKQV